MTPPENSLVKVLEWEKRYRLFAEKTGRIFLNIDLVKERVECVGAIKDITGYDAEKFQEIDINTFKELFHPKDRKRIAEVVELSFETGEYFNEEYRLRRKDGKYIYLENSAIFLKDKRGQPDRVLGVLRDITEKALSRQKLDRTREKFLYVAEQTGQLIYDIDTGTNKIEWAGAIEEITGFTPEELSRVALPALRELINTEDRERVWSAFNHSLKTGEKFYQEYWSQKKDGSYIYVENSSTFLKDEDGKVYRALGVMKNINERVRNREKLQKSEDRLQTYMQNFKGIGFQLDRNFTPVLMQGAVEEILGYTPEEILSEKIKCLDVVEPEDRDQLVRNQRKLVEDPKNVIDHEYRIRHRDGTVRWVHEIIQNISDSVEEPWLFQGSIIDITDRKNAEEFIKRIEEIRKKEIHHRIKNNLQVISSLLDLQAEKFTDAKVVEAFRESQRRVISMSMIHEELYKSKDVENLDFTSYLRKLVSELFLSYKLENAEVSLRMDVQEDIFLNMDIAIPLGIIVNELVCNSLKYAFSQESKGEICIELHSMENAETPKNFQYILTISDNGSGFPENINFENLNSLGLQLVKTLVEQIKGEVEIKRDHGTDFQIRFGK